jgi:hypothetical protein
MLTKFLSLFVELPADNLGRAPLTSLGLLVFCLALTAMLLWAIRGMSKPQET